MFLNNSFPPHFVYAKKTQFTDFDTKLYYCFTDTRRVGRPYDFAAIDYQEK